MPVRNAPTTDTTHTFQPGGTFESTSFSSPSWNANAYESVSVPMDTICRAEGRGGGTGAAAASASAIAAATSAIDIPSSSTAFTSSAVGTLMFSGGVPGDMISVPPSSLSSSSSSPSASDTMAEVFRPEALASASFESILGDEPKTLTGEGDGVGVKSLSEMITGSSSSIVQLLLWRLIYPRPRGIYEVLTVELGPN